MSEEIVLRPFTCERKLRLARPTHEPQIIYLFLVVFGRPHRLGRWQRWNVDVPFWQALASLWGRCRQPFRQRGYPHGRLVCFSVISVAQMGALGPFSFGPVETSIYRGHSHVRISYPFWFKDSLS